MNAYFFVKIKKKTAFCQKNCFIALLCGLKLGYFWPSDV
ncbi:hypothetical protein SGRA_0855 [Saprospira grandis str. Lewin]|uniref:Uncharacterized protein n=1 Tax=Saprospira grandis (strain Lewin) TaxID=984262 RepID=H6L2D3_SAPGL|nr:hypothetical protein SGRA_0855 [Saprospira grandis str. Lewin]